MNSLAHAIATHSTQPCSLFKAAATAAAHSSSLKVGSCLQVWNGKQITAAIKNSSTTGQLAALIDQHIDSMNTISLSAAIMKLFKLQAQQPQPYAVCLQRYLQFAAADSTRSLSNVVYALCKAPQVIQRQHQAALQQQLVPAFMAKCAEANAQDISNVLYGMADGGQQLPEEAVQQLLAVFIGQLHQATVQELFNTLLAMATMGQQGLQGSCSSCWMLL
jgi:hypothetical protein